MADDRLPEDTCPAPAPAPTAPKRGLLKSLWRLIHSPVGLLIVLIIYSIIGAILFKNIEGPHEAQEKYDLVEMREDIINSMWNNSNALKNRVKFAVLVRDELRKYESQLYSAFAHGINTESEKTVWDFWGSMVYSATIYTTIGYGHIAPATTAGRIATMIYALIGIPLCLIVLAEFGKLFTIVLKFFYAIPRRLVLRQSGAYAIDDEFNLPVIVAILVSMLYIFAGALMYMQWEEWDYLEAFYFIFISVSTVGFGDVLPENNKYFLASFAYQLFGLALVAMVINVVMDVLSISLTRAKVSVVGAGRSVGIDLGVDEEEDKPKME